MSRHIIQKASQGSGEWLNARLGIPTASRFDNIVTPTGKAVASASRTRYMHELLGERFTGLSASHGQTAAMMRGSELEPRAVAWYQMATNEDVQRVGFVWHDKHRRWGGSPDGLVGGDGGIEIKCPMTPNYIEHLRGMSGKGGGAPSQYFVQMQACMWICERPWWDFVLYTDAPGLPSLVVRVERDDKVCAAFDEHVPAFCDELDAAESELRTAYPEIGTRTDSAHPQPIDPTESW